MRDRKDGAIKNGGIADGAVRNGEVGESERTGKNLEKAAAVVRLFAEERKRRGLSKNALATLTGLNQSTMSRFENQSQNPMLDSLVRVADALEFNLGEVMKTAIRNVDSDQQTG